MTIKPSILMKPVGKFLAFMIGTAVMCLGAYVFTVDRLVQDSNMPASYKWFLLKNVPGPRLIFESGSNSHHGLDTDMISEALGMTAINIADNGGYALEDKITRLETYTRPGDIIVLPLEWTFYHREQLTDNYAETLFTDNRDYYRSMPLLKRVKRALSLPPEKVMAGISKVKSRLKAKTESSAQELYIAALTQPSGHQSRAVSIGPGLGVDTQSCDDYILGKAEERQRLKLGANIKPILARLKKLERRGVKIHFAWPAIAGEGCMTDPAYVSGFRVGIERAVNKAGFEFLAAPSQSLYGQEVQDDSPYHLTTEGTTRHTQKMIDHLKAQGYGQFGAPLNIRTFARHRLFEMEVANILPLEQSALPIGERIAMGNLEQRHYAEFSAGWWGFEPYGRWMRDNRAMFRVTLPANAPKNTVLKVDGVTKSGKTEQVDISINGVLIKSGPFGAGVPLMLPMKDLPREEALSIFLTLPEAGSPQSPFDLGENQDSRTMTLHVQSLLLSASEPLPLPQFTRPTLPEKEITTQSAALSLENMTPVFTKNTTNKCTSRESMALTHSRPIEFAQGWWPQEASGRWMKDQKATLKLDLPQTVMSQTSGRYHLKLKGDFFQEVRRPIFAMIDGQQSLPLQIDDEGYFITSFEVSPETKNVTVTLMVAGDLPQSPKALGLSADERVLTYFLKSADLVPA